MSVQPSTGHDPELKWFKSSYSTDDGPACVEVAFVPGTVWIRDSKRHRSPQLTVGAKPWSAFVSYTTAH
ncbi:DUF397 domain-containing protein [Streptomyces sp. NPDC006012]|uniref:DUF397 domain-containing protein n=1 Tax=Streptomyces sp. NPDC006012 TaxID=3364739 RepID=UPI0036CC0E46